MGEREGLDGMKRVVVESPLAAPVHEWRQQSTERHQCVRCMQSVLIWGAPPRTVAECLNTRVKPCSSAANIRYAQLCLLDCLQRGEAPFASHLLYTQVLDDRQSGEHEAGIRAGLEWAELADVCALYEDFGISPGMERGMKRADRIGVPVECRKLPPHLMARLKEPPNLWETLR